MQSVVLLVADSQLRDYEVILEDLNIVVNEGLLPIGLYPPEELAEVVEKLQAQLKLPSVI